MADRSEESAATPPLSDTDIVAYLEAHPDFLQRHPKLVRKLAPPSRFEVQEDGAEVIDMQGFMVSRLQADLAKVRDSQDELIQSARSNLSSQKQIHEAVLTSLDARDLEEFIHIVTHDFPMVLDVDAISICVERDHVRQSDVSGMFVIPKGGVDAALGEERRVLLRDRADGSEALFGPAAALVRSDALVRLQLTGSAPAAMIALGSREIGRFHPGQGTELLSFLAEVLEKGLRRWLDLPPA
ncbi:DUF484 family protein [Minwuia sp.]|uniref:DUF484 family protein n=1 Tax=Minwuia sp. TaxID=2493630 RepID=UPI003A90B5CF